MYAATNHRPWAVPAQPWIMEMCWHDLLFIHYPVPTDSLRPLLPPGLTLDTYDGVAWIGIVPFRMSGVRPRLVPPIPGCSAFPELNVRTYVTAEGKPGVWFFSLDATNPLAVEGARLAFHLPYYNARMSADWHGDTIEYDSRRTHSGAPPATLRARYRPVGPVYRSTPGTLESWLTERYCLYAANRHSRIWRCAIHHEPWPLQQAELDTDVNTMTDQIRLKLPAVQPLLHFARFIDVIAWLPQALPTSRQRD